MNSNQRTKFWDITDCRQTEVVSDVLRKILDQNQNIEYGMIDMREIFGMGGSVQDDMGVFRMDGKIIGLVWHEELWKGRFTTVYTPPFVGFFKLLEFREIIQNGAKSDTTTNRG